MGSADQNQFGSALPPTGELAERPGMGSPQVFDALSRGLGMTSQEPNDHRPLWPNLWDYGALASQCGPFLIGLGTCAGAVIAYLHYGGAQLGPL
jgi:hypothetical protein